VLLNPYIAGGIFVDYLVRGRYPLIERNAPVLNPDELQALESSSPAMQSATIPTAEAPNESTEPASGGSVVGSSTRLADSVSSGTMSSVPGMNTEHKLP
jgi:hypothetical protein